MTSVFNLNNEEMARLNARMLASDVDVDSLSPVCLTSRDCNPRDYHKSATHGNGEIIEM